ncbi:MAG: hypothetical protein JWM53_1469 [bacterium]|nr:hypothetical protein [bacterium]
MRRLSILVMLVGGCAHTTTSTTPTATSTFRSTAEQKLDVMTAALEREDFAGALQGTDEWLATKPEIRALTLIYNCRTWIRWGGGDMKGAVDENEKLRETVAGADAKVAHGALLHYWWDRSYLEAEAGRASDAERSRAEFERIATAPDDADSKKVLEAWLLVMRGDGAAARKAANAVDVVKDGDLQDLYVVARALEAGGDAAGAEKLRAQIRKGPRYPMKPLILQQMVRDASRAATRR